MSPLREPGRLGVALLGVVIVLTSAPALVLPLGLIFGAGTLAGWVFVKVLGQPALVGMLLAGLILRNVLPPALGLPDLRASYVIRGVALATIMLRAGLGLEVEAVAAQPLRLSLLAIVPCLLEAVAAALAAMVLLPASAGLGPASGGPAVALWGLVLGFVLADVSPAVAVPILLDLQAKGYGRRQGVPSLLLAAASLNAVVAIVGFGFCLQLAMAATSAPHNSSPEAAMDADPRVPSQNRLALSSLAWALTQIVGGAAIGVLLGALATLVAVDLPRDRPSAAAALRLAVAAELPGGRRQHESGAVFKEGRPGGALGRGGNVDEEIGPGPTSSAEENEEEGEGEEDEQATAADAIPLLPVSTDGPENLTGPGNPHAGVSSPTTRGALALATALGGAASAAIFAAKALECEGAGALAVVVAGATARVLIQHPQQEIEKTPGGTPEPLADLRNAEALLGSFWNSVAQVGLFGLLGAAIDLSTLDKALVLTGLSVVASGLAARVLAVFAVTSTGTAGARRELAWSWKDQVFSAIAWCPKATVQAALAAVASEAVLARGEESYPSPEAQVLDSRRADAVLTVAVISIFATAPIFAYAMQRAGPLLLEQEHPRGGL